ncbi:hypothetical protein TNCV_1592641 [Trichonephila clavipes]|nr:hypothetical protein TNCV_1592641 [Trichonephila clavipes]
MKSIHFLSGSNGGQTSTNGQEGSTVYLVGLERNNLSGDASHGQTLKSNLYCQLLDRLKIAIDQNWPTEEVLCSIRTMLDRTLM